MLRAAEPPGIATLPAPRPYEYEERLPELPPLGGEAKAAPLALVALGGYGRRELAPHSDVDLLLLHERGEPDAFAREESEKFLYSLWDLGLQVGYSVRDLA